MSQNRADKEPRSKHDPASTSQRQKTGLRSRSHAVKTPDGRFRCMECGYIANTLEGIDAHHFRTHERQPPITYAGTPP